MRLYKFLPLLIVLFLSAPIVFAQGGYEDLLYQEVEVENPVYMPVLGIGAGVINYYGELQNDYRNMIQGQPAYRINVYQYIDNKHFWKININATFGNISGYERSFEDTSKNLNFKSTLFGVGLNVEYSFGNIYKGERKIVPFISLGGEYISFSSKTDIVYKENGVALGNYVYYPDGTIRVGDRLVSRDYDYETDIRSWNPYVREDYDPSSFSIVADLGLDFKVSDRVALRLATSLHYTFTDDIDGVSFENTVGRIGDTKMDMFSFTYVALNIDLFSEAKTKMIESLFADVSGDFDYTLIADDDRDGVLNLADNCLETPTGVPVDSVGCPHDDDNDGVPNYIDKEQFSNKGAIVDEFGAELSANKIREGLFMDLTAVDRTEVYMMPVGLGWSKYSEMTNVEIPEKYKKLDQDGDGYISFDELLDAINEFFDFDSEFNTEDIYDLNNFFFAQ
jgi:Ca2+-binding EF-hand superfamily protein